MPNSFATDLMLIPVLALLNSLGVTQPLPAWAGAEIIWESRNAAISATAEKLLFKVPPS